MSVGGNCSYSSYRMAVYRQMVVFVRELLKNHGLKWCFVMLLAGK